MTNIYDIRMHAYNNNYNKYCTIHYRDEYWDKYDIEPDNVTHTDPDDGNGKPEFTNIEAYLDTQFITSIGELVPLQVWYTYNESQIFSQEVLDWITDVTMSDNPPPLFSVSYGWPEDFFGEDLINRINIEFAKAGARGITILFASGDGGAGGEEGCGYNNITQEEYFMPMFPASSIYITSIGGVTDGDPDINININSIYRISSNTNEQVWEDGGGGFSLYQSIQSWQKDAVNDYFSNNSTVLPDSNRYNSSGRAYPDISAQSARCEIYKDFKTAPVSGTSCSTPIVAGIFALLNDLRLANNMSSLGFANPLIYELASKNSSNFNDVTIGSNFGCYGRDPGFSAAVGWDPASGWGSPNYQVLKEYVMQTGEKTKKYAQKRKKQRRGE